ncbi:hypothetical protein Tco_0587512 [Tanacetum coccineum]
MFKPPRALSDSCGSGSFFDNLIKASKMTFKLFQSSIHHTHFRKFFWNLNFVDCGRRRWDEYEEFKRYGDAEGLVLQTVKTDMVKLDVVVESLGECVDEIDKLAELIGKHVADQYCLHTWYLDDGTIVGDTLFKGKVLEFKIEDGPRRGLHLNVDKTEFFWPKEDPRSMIKGVFPPNIARPLHGVKLLAGSASVDFDFSCEFVMKRSAKSIGLMDVVAKINDPQCELMLLRACTDISKLYFDMRTCSLRVFEMAQRSFDADLRCALERIVTASGPGFGDVLNYAFLASRLQSASLQTKLLRYPGIVSSRPTFDDALCVFNTSMETDLLSNSNGKEVDIGLDVGRTSPLTQTGLTDFVPCRAVSDATHRKHVKYEAKCADMGYDFLPFSFSSFGELEKDAVALLKRI